VKKCGLVPVSYFHKSCITSRQDGSSRVTGDVLQSMLMILELVRGEQPTRSKQAKLLKEMNQILDGEEQEK